MSASSRGVAGPVAVSTASCHSTATETFSEFKRGGATHDYEPQSPCLLLTLTSSPNLQGCAPSHRYQMEEVFRRGDGYHLNQARRAGHRQSGPARFVGTSNLAAARTG